MYKGHNNFTFGITNLWGFHSNEFKQMTCSVSLEPDFFFRKSQLHCLPFPALLMIFEYLESALIALLYSQVGAPVNYMHSFVSCQQVHIQLHYLQRIVWIDNAPSSELLDYCR